MGGEYSNTFFTFSIPIWLITGYLLLHLEAAIFRSKKMKKEAAVSRGIGWLNVAIGLAIWVGQWFT
ncbi:CLC_0170 family protein [Cohnella sp. REN36]|uniref:CLC_0170 family protein n=1 Tax=Cohnella sp. REN36 TaxID=2887347 RepID=UPI001D13DAC0|nr:CLC_0170 family protein [Cohnella sp. REN36]MCC3374396.1 hypothetical protein [Cohnella sp. REN36]